MSLHSFCPSCDRIPYIEINTKEVYLNCDHCQFNSLNNYLQQVKDIKPSIVAQSNRKIDKLKEVIKLAHNHLTNYFSKIKSERITSLLNKIQLIESEYQKSYTDNKNVISLLEVLINNYSNQYGRMFNNILSNSNQSLEKWKYPNRGIEPLPPTLVAGIITKWLRGKVRIVQLFNLNIKTNWVYFSNNSNISFIIKV